MVASMFGGVNIEEVFKSSPDSIYTDPIDITKGTLYTCSTWTPAHLCISVAGFHLGCVIWNSPMDHSIHVFQSPCKVVIKYPRFVGG